MKVRIIYNSWFAANIVGANITLYPFIFLIADEATARKTFMLAHEWIHVVQVRQLGWFKFYSTYLFQYIKNLIKYRDGDKAYYCIDYEQEAYSHQTSFTLPSVLE